MGCDRLNGEAVLPGGYRIVINELNGQSIAVIDRPPSAIIIPASLTSTIGRYGIAGKIVIGEIVDTTNQSSQGYFLLDTDTGLWFGGLDEQGLRVEMSTRGETIPKWRIP
jgi:hypothetical protein